ncbi:hypothetical protein Dimus_023454 [Dionaea muscipula]
MTPLTPLISQAPIQNSQAQTRGPLQLVMLTIQHPLTRSGKWFIIFLTRQGAASAMEDSTGQANGGEEDGRAGLSSRNPGKQNGEHHRPSRGGAFPEQADSDDGPPGRR